MPRIARIIIPNCPHHVIQRGNRRLKAFFNDSDKELYLHILKDQGEKWEISFWAYCLMDNHVHLIAVPKYPWSLAKGIGETHRRYTNIINIRENWKGYLWQGRFISYPLDEKHLFFAVRYIERNPVRGGLVKRAEDYSWSSARAHVYGVKDILLSDRDLPLSIDNWASFLLERDDEQEIERFKKHEGNGRPLGDELFIQNLERMTGRLLSPQKPGRKKRTGSRPRQ